MSLDDAQTAVRNRRAPFNKSSNFLFVFCCRCIRKMKGFSCIFYLWSLNIWALSMQSVLYKSTRCLRAFRVELGLIYSNSSIVLLDALSVLKYRKFPLFLVWLKVRDKCPFSYSSRKACFRSRRVAPRRSLDFTVRQRLDYTYRFIASRIYSKWILNACRWCLSDLLSVLLSTRIFYFLLLRVTIIASKWLARREGVTGDALLNVVY